jgi:protein phosphatase
MTPTHNQDYFVIDEELWNEKAGYLFVIADGMPSMIKDCHVAKLGAEAVYSKYYANTSDNRTAALKEAFEFANHQVHEVCPPDARTNCTAALLHGKTLHIAHLGICRAYQFRDHHLAQMTQDHTLAFEWVRKGIVTEDDLRTSPHSLYISARHLGYPSALELDIITERL